MDKDDVVLVHNDTVLIGFINSSGELEYSEYKHFDGGMITLDDTKEYKKEDLLELLLANIRDR
nr:hypothetical protein [uncultured Sulfurimonas sp.]